jgi:hypothetical protein
MLLWEKILGEQWLSNMENNISKAHNILTEKVKQQ